MEQRTIERFRKRVIAVHWLNAVAFATLLITGIIMFFDLTGLEGGRQIRIIHRVAGVIFFAIPVIFTILDPAAARAFIRTAFRWTPEDRAWLRQAPGFYFGKKAEMPPQGYINGDQKFWQLIVIVTGIVSVITGVMVWFFKFKMPLLMYQWVGLTHALSFVIVSFLFLVHLYLTLLHPAFDESLSSMIDGRVSARFARDRYGKWYAEQPNAEEPPETPAD